MKKLYFLLIISLMGIRFSYAQDTTSLVGKMQFIFAQLNRNDIATGFLEERAFPLVSLTPFNGSLTDSNKVQLNTLRAIYFTHYTACMLNTNPMLPIDSLNNRVNQYLPFRDTVPIAIHFGEMNAFKSDAVTNNLISIDGDDVLHDVSGRLQNPYLLKSLFAAAPLKSDFATGNFALVFKPNLFFSNSTLTVSSLYIDFDDGYGYQSAGWNTALYPNYNIAGTKNIKLKMVMSNSSQYECYAPITVTDIPPLGRYASYPPTPVHFYATGNHSGGKAYIRYSSSNSTGHLKKPLIVVEGYDAAQIAPNLVTAGNYSYDDIISAINATNSQAYDFNYQLDDIGGYDLVFIDYNYGTDDIVRNANLFKAVLNWVNADKALGGSTQQNVVLGISMGGLVARYGLAQMTKNNEATDTHLLITHDSPHQGANVPVGLQEIALNIGRVNLMGYNIDKVMPEYAEVKALIAEPATKQLLMYRVEVHENQLFPYFNFLNYYYSTIEQNTWLTSVYRPMVTFSTSDPQPTYRFIATSQGSECGTQLFSPGAKLLNVQGNAAGILMPFLGVYSKANASIEAHALPNIGASNQIAKIDIWVKKYFLGIRIDKDVFKYTKTINNSQFLPIDGAPGGTSPIGALTLSPTPAIGLQSLGDLFSLLYLGRLNTATLSDFAFVPTPSALDIQTYNVPSLSSTYVNGWNPTNPSRAETFIAQDASGSIYNESHTRFTARNAEWLFKEMENIAGNTLNCSSTCSPNTNSSIITGPTQICSTEIYEISNLPSGATVTWSIEGWGAEISSTSGNQAILSSVDYGEFSLKAMITTSCGSVTVSTGLITSGFPYMVSITDISNDGMGTTGGILCSNSPNYSNYRNAFSYEVQTAITSAISYPLTLNYMFIDQDGNFLNYESISISSGSGTIILPNLVPGFYNLEAWLSGGPCNGTSEWFEEWIEYVQCGGAGSLVVYPNPTSESLTISYENNEAPEQKSELYLSEKQISLFNDKGKTVRTNTMRKEETETTLDTRDLPNGTYFLHIKEGKETIKRQIIIQH